MQYNRLCNHTTPAARALAIDILIPVKWMIMAAMTVDTMLQSNGFQTKKKEDIENKDNLWYVSCYLRDNYPFIKIWNKKQPFVFFTLHSREMVFRFAWHILLLREKNWAFSIRSLFNVTYMLCRSSILAEVQNSSNNKLPSNKNVLVLGKCQRRPEVRSTVDRCSTHIKYLSLPDAYVIDRKSATSPYLC